LAPSSIG